VRFWLLLFLNTCAGISVISQEAPIFQELTKSKCGGRGQHGRNRQPWKRSRSRLLGVGIGSDHAPLHIPCDVHCSSSTVLVFPTITTASVNDDRHLHSADVLCGGFGTMPAFTADYFGPKNVGPIYGLMLTAWSFASAVGPLFIAHMRETTVPMPGRCTSSPW